MATLYFYAEVNNGELDWQTLANWWLDEAATSQPSPSLPAAEDDVVIYSTVATNSNAGTPPTVSNMLVTDVRANNNPYGETYLSIDVVVTGTATFTGSNSYLYTDDAALSAYAQITGNAVFRDGAATYGENGRPAVIYGDAEFYDNSYNYGAQITGNATVHYPAENPLGGTVLGVITYLDYPAASTSTHVFRALHFPHRRREVVSEQDHTPINVQPGEIILDEEQHKLYAGLDDGTVVEVGGGGGGSGDYLPLSGGTMTGSIVFDGTSGQYINKGNFDTSRGGSYGISLVCAIGYEFNWQAGWLITTAQNNTTPRPLYLDSVAGTTLRAWSAADNTGVEISHTGITFPNGSVQTEAYTGGGGGGNPFDQDLNTTNSVIFANAQVDNQLMFKNVLDNTDCFYITKDSTMGNFSVLKIMVGDDGGANINNYYPTGGATDYVAIMSTNSGTHHLFGTDGKYYNAGGIVFSDGTTQTTAGGGGGSSPYTTGSGYQSIQPVNGGNSAGGYRGAVGGGENNNANANYSTVSGGRQNTSGGNNSTVGGGYSNTASGYASTVSGGWNNTVSNNYSTVSGGRQNTVDGNYSIVSGGYANAASGYASTVGGGSSNNANSNYSTVSGGNGNTASNYYSTVGGGRGNNANSNYSTVSGGYANAANSNYSTVSGGYNNTASGYRSTVSGGYHNTANGSSSTVGGGLNNTASGYASTVGGYNNTASGDYSSVIGGSQNDTNSQSNAHILGQRITATAPNTTFVNNIKIVGYTYYDSNIGAYTTIGGELKFLDDTTQTSAGVTSATTGIAGAASITNIVSMTQAAYDALASKDESTLYIING